MIEILQPHVLDDADELARFFHSAQPFPHVVIDGFLRDDVVERLLGEFPLFERGDSLDESGQPGLKSSFQAMRELGPGFARIDDLVRHPEFLGFLGRITGIEGLLFDPDYIGGGTHENLPGQDLDPHVDFNYHPGTGWHRRLNLLLYLNPEWREQWGGCLELHSDPWRATQDLVTTVLPVLNRCVIFETSERSWHGFLPITPPAGKPRLSRRSLALYFYSQERPSAETAPAHATVYVERALPALAEGQAVTEGESADVRRLTGRRHEHIERLFRREQALVALMCERLHAVLLPGSTPAAEALDVLWRLVSCQDEALQALYRRETELSTLLSLLESSTRLPVRLAPSLSLAATLLGCWDDGWVGSQLRIRMKPSRDLRGIVVCGTLPEPLGPEQELTLQVHGRAHTRQVRVGEFEWPVVAELPAGVMAEIEIGAQRTLCPKTSGLSEDARELAWMLRRLDARPAEAVLEEHRR